MEKTRKENESKDACDVNQQKKPVRTFKKMTHETPSFHCVGLKYRKELLLQVYSVSNKRTDSYSHIKNPTEVGFLHVEICDLSPSSIGASFLTVKQQKRFFCFNEAHTTEV